MNPGSNVKGHVKLCHSRNLLKDCFTCKFFFFCCQMLSYIHTAEKKGGLFWHFDLQLNGAENPANCLMFNACYY